MLLIDGMINFFTTLDWVAVMKIIAIDIVLGGDNAVLIALACRDLPPELRKKGIIWGTAGAIILRVLLVTFAMSLLTIPFLKFISGILLVYIGIKLVIKDDDSHSEVKASDKFWEAVKTILVADLLMSIENVLAMAGAAQKADPNHQFGLIVFGILVSIPIVVAGSQLVLKALEKYPTIIILGGALLGWIGGGLIVSDIVFTKYFAFDANLLAIDFASIKISYVVLSEIIGAILVYALGKIIINKRQIHA